MPAKDWAELEFGNVDLGDVRRQERLVQLARQRGAHPQGSIAVSAGTAADTKAAYRWYENEAIDPAAIQSGHQQATLLRVQQAPTRVILAVQDTTVIRVSSRMVDAGYVNAPDQPGILVHSTLAVSPTREPFGVWHQQVWTRLVKDYPQEDSRRERAIGDKESQKWLTSLQAAHALQQAVPEKQVVSVGDREADIFEVFAQAAQQQVAVLVRAAQDRRVTVAAAEDEIAGLWATVEQQPPAGQRQVEVAAHAEHPARRACLSIRFMAVTLQPPQRRAAEALPPCAVWAVLAREEKPPAGETPLEWLLLTTVPVCTFTEACERLTWYGVRWVVEMYHKVLKSGCAVDKRQFERVDTFQRYFALDAVVAWRVLYLTLISRQSPDLPCDRLLDTDEWQALYAFQHQTTTMPPTVPTLREAVRWLARLGGFLGRKSDKDPGTKVLWLGLQRLADITASWVMFQPLKKRKRCG